MIFPYKLILAPFLLEIKGRLLSFILLKNNYMASSHDYIEDTPNKKIKINKLNKYSL